jgi:hypothetical protein
MSKRPKRQTEINLLGRQIVEEATGALLIPPPAPKKNPAAVALGRLGGLKGGKARAERLTAQQRRDIAAKAARTRWKKQ